MQKAGEVLSMRWLKRDLRLHCNHKNSLVQRRSIWLTLRVAFPNREGSAMTKLALIEIDRTIADISRREQRAKAHAQTRVRELGARPGHEHLHDHYMGILYSQEGLYNPHFVPLDTPMS